MSNSLIKFLVVLQFIVGCALVSFAQEIGLKAIDKQDLQRHLTFLSSDSLQGRSFGTVAPGLDMAAAYIAENLERLGLEPINGSYFQPFSLMSSRTDSDKTFVKITDRKGNLIYETDSIFGFSELNEIQIKNTEMAFAGFGRACTNKKQNDFEGLDLNGKVVFIAAGNTDSFRKGKPFKFDFQAETRKMEYALEAGAAAVLLVNSPHDKNKETFSRLWRWASHPRYMLGTETSKKTKGIPLALTSFAVADVMLGGEGKSLKLLSKIAKKEKANSIEINDLNIDIAVKQKSENFETKNVIGIVEGSDPVLKDECVVFMAHYDHLGMDDSGNVYNGADDNGSGTVTLLEVAEAFQALSEKPKRSIVFLWPAAEEIGMFGSQYYSENPVIPLKKTVACINIDMNGRVFEPRDTVWKRSPKMVKDFDGLFTLTNDVWPALKTINSQACITLDLVPDYELPSYFLRSSDHYSFHKNGVPVLNYSTGYHADYHKVTDEISKIDFDKMKRVADLCFLVGLEIANRDTITFER